ncbi:PilW family protein [Zhongshania sp.]|uniref:PilW family protein n=1 Tax=Zhongshania sp. TaxID=1971902 RepID=UPI003564343F
MKNTTMSSTRHTQGFGLVELMIAVTLGLLLTAATIQTVLSASLSQRLQSGVAQVQDSTDYSFQLLSRDLRMAGYIGCPSIDEANINLIAANPPTDVRLSASEFIAGQDNVSVYPDDEDDDDEGGGEDDQGENNSEDGASENELNILTSSDTITASWADAKAASVREAMALVSDDIELASNPANLTAGDFAIISDCVSADLFVVTSVSTTSDGVTIGHGSAKTTTANLSKAYGEDAEVYGFSSARYEIKNTGRTTSSGDAVFSLYGAQRRAGSGGSDPASTELVEGVENIQLLYGRDTNSNGSINDYVVASAVSDWSVVASVRIELLLAANIDATVSGPQTLNFNGNTLNFDDGRYRQVSTAVIALRNRLP